MKELLITEDQDFSLDVSTNYISKSVLKYLSSVDSPTGIIGVCELKKMELKGDKILILDGVQDPGNMGTIIRSSVAFNVDTIVINEKCADPFNVNIVKYDLDLFLNSIKGKMPIYGTKVTGGTNLKTIEKNDKFAIIMGNEGSGVSDELLKLCDEYIYIPMNKNCESLNVGVATSIILYEFVR